MKYVRGFFTFWRHFILGDDSTIAIVVLWSLLFTWSLSAYFFNIWIVVPLCVTAVLVALCYDKVARRPLLYGRSEVFKYLIATALPFCIVVAVPSLIFRFINHMMDVQYTLIPLGICVGSATILAFVLYEVYKRFPSTIAFLFGAAAYLTVLLR